MAQLRALVRSCWRLLLRLAGVLPVGSRASHGVYAVLSWLVIAPSRCFDARWYAMQSTGQTTRQRPAALWHYVARGRRDGRSPHPFFEPAFHEPSSWRTARMDPFAAYLRRGPRPEHPVHPLLDDAATAAQLPADRRSAAAVLRLAGRGDAELTTVVAAAHSLDQASTSGSATAPADAAVVAAVAARATLTASVGVWHHHAGLRGVERFTPDYDTAREQRFLEAWAQVPVPDDTEHGVVVSVVLPCWNRADRVGAAIRSVQAQTVQAWELLVVDDGSTDSSADVAEAIAAEDPRVVVLRREHAGVCAARNAGLRRARGAYVAFLDSDNTYLPTFLATASAAMAGQGLAAAYAILRATDAEGLTTYRSLEASDEVLHVRNFVDLNVLVVSRELMERVGGFDEGLRRTVDYDLVLRLRAHTDLVFLPFVAVDYHHDAEDMDRITTREAASWVEVVQRKNLVDWAALEQRTQVAGRTSVVLVLDDSTTPVEAHEEIWALLASVTAADDVEVVVVDNGASRATGVVATSWTVADDRVVLVRQPANRYRALAVDMALPHASGDVVAVVRRDVVVHRGWVGACREALDEGVAAVQPLLLTPPGTIHAAGCVLPPGRGLPSALLGGHPIEDAQRAGAVLRVPALEDSVLVARVADVVAERGLDPIFRNAWDVTDLSLRLSARGQLLCVTGATATVVESPPPVWQRAVASVVNRRLLDERWHDHGTRGQGPWAELGYDVVGWQQHRTRGPAGPRGARAVVARVAVREHPGSWRWALKIGAPPGDAGRSWGDVHFAEALAGALRRLGQEVVVDTRSAHDRSSAYLDDVVLAVRGLVAVNPAPGAVSICWVISHPELVAPAELSLYDRAFAASATWAARMSAQSRVQVRPLLQCTDPRRFTTPRDDGVLDRDEPRTLFVGNSRNVFRSVVRDALAVDPGLTLYGSRWEQFVGAKAVAGSWVPNERLATLYAASGVVLNDHWDDMRAEGFMSNRLFDATATAARVVTDDIAGTEIFEGLVRPYRDTAELRSLLLDPYDRHFPDRAARVAVAARLRREHSFDARAATLLDAAREEMSRRCNWPLSAT